MKREWIRRLARAWVRAISLVWTSAPRLACAQAVLTAVQALLPLLTLYTLKRGVNRRGVVTRDGYGDRGTSGRVCGAQR